MIKMIKQSYHRDTYQDLRKEKLKKIQEWKEFDALKKLNLEDPAEQQRVSRMIYDQKFGTEPEVLRELARFIGQVEWDESSQKHLATAIFCKKFGEDVPDELIASYVKIKWSLFHKATLSFFESRYWYEIQKIRAEEKAEKS